MTIVLAGMNKNFAVDYTSNYTPAEFKQEFLPKSILGISTDRILGLT